MLRRKLCEIFLDKIQGRTVEKQFRPADNPETFMVLEGSLYFMQTPEIVQRVRARISGWQLKNKTGDECFMVVRARERSRLRVSVCKYP